MRLTVCNVVPVISATSCRLIGKSISIAGLGLAAGLLGEAQQRMRDALLDLLARHLHARAPACPAAGCPTVCSALAASDGNRAVSRGHAAAGQHSATLSTAATAVAG